MKSSFKNVSHRVHGVLNASGFSVRLTTECAENIWDLSVVSVRSLGDLCEKLFAFLQPSGKFMNNPGWGPTGSEWQCDEFFAACFCRHVRGKL